MVGLVALLVLGPERLPRVAREAALWLRKARSVVNSAKADIKRELDLAELNELRALKESIQVPPIASLSMLEDAVARPKLAETPQCPTTEPTGEANV